MDEGTLNGTAARMNTQLDWATGPGAVDNGDGTYTVYADPSQAFEYYWSLDGTAENLSPGPGGQDCTGDVNIVNAGSYYDSNGDLQYFGNRIHTAGSTRTDTFNTCPPGTFFILDNELGVIEIYPNPFVDRISVNTEEAINVVRIYDLTGRMVQQATTNKANFSLNVADLSKGVYLVKLNAGNKEATLKLAK